MRESGKTDKQWVILLASFHRDRLGHYFTARDITTLLASKAKVPIYAINDNSLVLASWRNMIMLELRDYSPRIIRKFLMERKPEYTV
jgi:hypothetical protein